jgi:hypothetical protein
MAAVIHLEAGAEPPNDPGSLIVARDLTGGFYALEPGAYARTETPSDQPISEPDRTATIDRAAAYADQHGLKTVYVVS